MAKANKTPTYVLHGWTKDTKKWDPLIKGLKKNGLKVKMLKIPGLTDHLDTPWDIENYIDWLDTQTEKEKQVNIIAHSFGGRVAIHYDVKRPNKIKKLILIDSAGIRPDNIPAVIKRASFKALAKIGKKITKHQKARKVLYSLTGERDYYKADKVLAKTMANIVEFDQRDELSFVKAHTLILWGSKDKTTPLSDGRLMNKTITGSSLSIIDGAGHSPQYSHSEIVKNHILDFLS
jgi:pimeloyl-ACP methyl ester carboxylesterase